MGAPFIASRKKEKDKVPKCKRPGRIGKKLFMNNNNRYQSFDIKNNPKRSQILTNFKQITRIINKNFIKQKKKEQLLELSDTDSETEEKKNRKIEEKQNIIKMNHILRELSVREWVPKVKAYPTNKYN